MSESKTSHSAGASTPKIASSSIDYKTSGVDVSAGDALVDWLTESQSTPGPHHERVLSGIGGFAALFKGSFPNLKSPILVSGTDGVGTKVKLAVEFDTYEEVAQDMVAMCINDILCTGAQPLFFLDYYACGKLDLVRAQRFLSGVRAACKKAQCALIGGETAEMPGVYAPLDFDCAGFAVGVVEESEIWGASRVRVGDRLIALPSSGFHSNGFSLLRKVFAEDLGEWRDALIVPTRLYVDVLMKLKEKDLVRAAAHITGGGLDNSVRVVPENTHLRFSGWKIPAPFWEVKSRTHMDWHQMLSTLNCGLGMILIVSPAHVSAVLQTSQTLGHAAFEVGVVEASDQKEPSWSVNESLLEKGV